MAEPTKAALPLEIVQEIVAKIAPWTGRIPDRKIFQTLVSCSLTSRHFAYAARRRLFSTLVLSQDAWHFHKAEPTWAQRSEEELMNRFNALIDILTDEASDLALMVRELDIHVDQQYVLIRKESQLHGVLSALCLQAVNLNYLRLVAFNSTYRVSWTSLPRETVDALRDLWRTLPVRQIDFTFCSDIPPFHMESEQNPQLQYISMYHSRFKGSDAHSWDILRNNLPVHTDLWGCLPENGLYEVHHAPDDVINFISMDVNLWSSEDVGRLNLLLFNKQFCTSLKSCHWTLHCDLNASLVGQGFDVGAMQRLQRLSIVKWETLFSPEPSSDNSVATNFISVVDLLHHGLQKSKLEAIEVTFRFSIDYTGKNTWCNVDYSSLKGLRIDSLIQKYPFIQKVALFVALVLRWRISSDNSDGDKSVEEHNEAFKDCVQTSILEAVSADMHDDISLPTIQVSVA